MEELGVWDEIDDHDAFEDAAEYHPSYAADLLLGMARAKRATKKFKKSKQRKAQARKSVEAGAAAVKA